MIKGNFKDKNTQMELLEKKNIVYDVKKKSIRWIYSRLDTIKENISEFEHRAKRNLKQTERLMKTNKKSVRYGTILCIKYMKLKFQEKKRRAEYLKY